MLAFEVCRSARWRRAVLVLVAVVQAVVVTVANPSFGDAPLVVTGEIPRVRAGFDGRLGRGVGAAGLAITVQLFAVRTPADGLNPDAGGVVGNWEAELLAAAVVGMAWVIVIDLLGFLGVDLDAVQSVGLLHLLHDLLVGPGDLVHFDDGVQPPVGDKEFVAENNEAERMPDLS